MRISDWSSGVCSSDLIGVYLHQEIAPDRHGLGFRVVDVVGDDGTAACDFIPDEFGRDVIRDGSAPVLPVAGIFFQAFTPQILSLCDIRSEEHTSELQSLMRISYAVFCLKKKKKTNKIPCKYKKYYKNK